MKDILAQAQRQVLRRFTDRRVLLAFDFDGTLAPIVRDPDAATMPRSTRALFTNVARLYPTVVISGRARADVAKRLSGIPLRAVLGNHGMEPSPEEKTARRLVAGWHGTMAAGLPDIPGVVLEDKGTSLAIHYRLARARAEARRTILGGIANLPKARIIEGKCVVNLLPDFAPDKGEALLRLCRRLRCPCAIYLGDDDNDEDAFNLADAFPVLGIRVGHAPHSRADYFVRKRAHVNALLSLLIKQRETDRAKPRAL